MGVGDDMDVGMSRLEVVALPGTARLNRAAWEVVDHALSLEWAKEKLCSEARGSLVSSSFASLN